MSCKWQEAGMRRVVGTAAHILYPPCKLIFMALMKWQIGAGVAHVNCSLGW